MIYQTNQFEPVRNGSIEKAAPTAENKQAAESALGGTDYSQGALYFRAVNGADGSWHETALVRLFDYGGHRFYK